MAEIDETSQALGRIEEKVDGLVRIVGGLPCSNQDNRIRKVETYQNKQIGIIVTVGALMGFIGWMISPIISWLLDQIK